MCLKNQKPKHDSQSDHSVASALSLMRFEQTLQGQRLIQIQHEYWATYNQGLTLLLIGA